jgi:hypothetical protein
MASPTAPTQLNAPSKPALVTAARRRSYRLAADAPWLVGSAQVAKHRGSDQASWIALCRARIRAALLPAGRRCLGWLSWLTAGLALAAGAAKNPAELQALASLAEQRGYVAAAVNDARGLAAMRRIVRLTLVPALVLSLLALALAGSLGVAAVRLLFVIGAVGYVHVLALLVGGLAHLAATLAPRHGRSLLLLFLFLPHVARVIWSSLPSVPWAPAGCSSG